MINFINKNKLLATTAICAISVCANTVKAEEIDILSILNNSTTKSPDITWTTEGATSDDIEILGKYYKYIIADNPTRKKYDEHETDPVDVIADFVGSTYKKSEDALGGAINNNYTYGSIPSITGDFIDNSATSTNSFAFGGAIRNGYFGEMGSITGDFIGNSATGEYAYGGAVYNETTISSITGNFIGNSAIGNSYARGGAVYNGYDSTIKAITGYFIGNSATGYDANGGAIYNSSTISSITGDFEGNSANSINGDASGGAIYSGGTISSITGDFIGNSATGNSSASGGAIYYGQYGRMSLLIGDFTHNSATSTSGDAVGGAIYNKGRITSITGDFEGNSATGGADTRGGAIYNEGEIETIIGDFTNNSATSTNGNSYGGAIYNYGGTNLSITGDFVGNSANSTNGNTYGGAIYNESKSMLQAKLLSTYGYESFEEYAQNRWRMSGEDLLAKYDISSEDEITPEIAMYMNSGVSSAEEYAWNNGYYSSVGAMLDARGYSSMEEMAEANGYYDRYITIVADASDSEDSLQDDVLFQGNYVEDKEGKRYEAIYNIGIINFESNNGGSYTFYDYIDGNNGTLNFVSDNNEKATFNLYNNIQNQGKINFQNKYVINMISADDIHAGTSKYSYIQAQNININAALQMMLDVDLEAKEMDRFEADNFTVADGGSIDVLQLNIIQDVTVKPTDKIEVPFIVMDDISKATGLDKISTNITEVSGTNYTYTVTFNPETGAFEFTTTGLGSEPVEPSAPAPEEVAPNQAPSLNVNTTVATVDTVITQIFDRDVMVSADTNYGADTTDYMKTSDVVNIRKNKRIWVKTFGSDDDVEVDHFNGTIDAEAYGVVGGVDSKVFTYDNGVKAAYGIYGAYVGGKQKYNDSKITQDSGYLGVSASFRKNNLFSNFTLNGGYVTSESNTELGKDEFDTKVVSVANKTGVDIKAGNNWTITPAMYVAYTGMDTEDYTNKAGVKMENEFANVVTLAPEVKVRKGFNNGVGAYAKASYKHYIYDSEVKADDIVLEEMSAKPYVEYGFGVEKNWADKSGYAELTRRDGGREGWNVNLGLNLDF